MGLEAGAKDLERLNEELTLTYSLRSKGSSTWVLGVGAGIEFQFWDSQGSLIGSVWRKVYFDESFVQADKEDVLGLQRSRRWEQRVKVPAPREAKYLTVRLGVSPLVTGRIELPEFKD